jgi:hypothetical protein
MPATIPVLRIITMSQRDLVRQAVRNFLYPLSLAEMERELVVSIEMDDPVRARCINDYINECIRDDHDYLMRKGA